MGKLLNKNQTRKQISKVAKHVRHRQKLDDGFLAMRLNDPKTTVQQKVNAELLSKHGRPAFSDEEIIDVVWGRKELYRLLPATLWFRPRDILSQLDAMIYITKILSGNPCDGSEKVELSRLQFELAVVTFAEGLCSENVYQSKSRSYEECLAYARRQIRTFLLKSPEFNGEKYVATKHGPRVGQGSSDPTINLLRTQLNSKSSPGERELSKIESQIETRNKELSQQRMFKKHLPRGIFEKYFNEDGTPKLKKKTG